MHPIDILGAFAIQQRNANHHGEHHQPAGLQPASKHRQDRMALLILHQPNLGANGCIGCKGQILPACMLLLLPFCRT